MSGSQNSLRVVELSWGSQGVEEPDDYEVQTNFPTLGPDLERGFPFRTEIMRLKVLQVADDD